MGRQSIMHALVEWRAGLSDPHVVDDKGLKKLARVLDITISTAKNAERDQFWIDLNVEIILRLLKQRGDPTAVLNIMLESLTTVPYWVQKCLQHINNETYKKGFKDGRSKAVKEK